MFQINIFKLATLVVAGLLIGACGAENPLKRGAKGDGSQKAQEKSVEETPEQFFVNNLLPALNNDCNSCHKNYAPNYEAALAYVVFGKPDESELYTKAIGKSHKRIWKPEDAEAAVLASWILGLENPEKPVEPPPIEPPPSEPPAGEQPPGEVPSPGEPPIAEQPPVENPPIEPPPAALNPEFFVNNLLPALNNDCNSCHENYAPNYEAALAYVVFGKPDESELYYKAIGKRHRKIWKPEDAEAAVLANWIMGAK